MTSLVEIKNDDIIQEEDSSFSSEFVRSLFIVKESENESPKHYMHIYKIYKNPDICFISDILTPDECDQVISLCENKWQSSLTSVGRQDSSMESYREIQSSSRTSDSVRLPKYGNKLIASIENRVATVMGIDSAYLEPLVVIRYKPNQFFNEHHDGTFRPKSLIIYLSDVTEGGETFFNKLGLAVPPCKGSGITWNNNNDDGSPNNDLNHSGVPPLNQEKYIINCFANSKNQIETAFSDN